MNDIDIAQLVASRLNHDYASPYTAISNGVELMTMPEGDSDVGISVVQESLKSALATLNFNRFAFGQADNKVQIKPSQLIGAIVNFLNVDNFSITFPSQNYTPTKSEAKAWTLMILCFRSSFSQLERVEINQDEHGWRVDCFGHGAINHEGEYRAEGLWLETEIPQHHTIHFYLFFQQLRRMNLDIVLKRSDDDGRLTLHLWEKNTR